MIKTYVTSDILRTVAELNPHETVVVPVSADYRFYDAEHRPLGLAARAAREFPIEIAMQSGYNLCPDSIYANGAILLVGKKHPEDCYEEWALRRAIQIMKTVCEHEEIRDLAIQPFCDDRIPWYKIKAMLIEELGSSINISIYTRY